MAALPRITTHDSPTRAIAVADPTVDMGTSVCAHRDIHVIGVPFGAAPEPPASPRANAPSVRASPPCASAITASSVREGAHETRDRETVRTPPAYYAQMGLATEELGPRLLG
jgi:hypothetical protein